MDGISREGKDVQAKDKKNKMLVVEWETKNGERRTRLFSVWRCVTIGCTSRNKVGMGKAKGWLSHLFVSGRKCECSCDKELRECGNDNVVMANYVPKGYRSRVRLSNNGGEGILMIGCFLFRRT